MNSENFNFRIGNWLTQKIYLVKKNNNYLSSRRSCIDEAATNSTQSIKTTHKFYFKINQSAQPDQKKKSTTTRTAIHHYNQSIISNNSNFHNIKIEHIVYKYFAKSLNTRRFPARKRPPAPKRAVPRSCRTAKIPFQHPQIYIYKRILLEIVVPMVQRVRTGRKWESERRTSTAGGSGRLV